MALRCDETCSSSGTVKRAAGAASVATISAACEKLTTGGSLATYASRVSSSSGGGGDAILSASSDGEGSASAFSSSDGGGGDEACIFQRGHQARRQRREHCSPRTLSIGRGPCKLFPVLRAPERVFLVTYVVYSIVYITRKAFSVVKPQLQRDLEVSTEFLGWVDSAFLGTYATFQVFLPALSDSNGVRVVLVTALSGVAICAVIFSLVSSPNLLLTVWLFEGVAHAPIFSVLVKSVSLWAHPATRARTLGLWTTSQQVGAIVATLVTTAVGARFGWRGAFFVAGAISFGAVWLVHRFLPEPPGAASGDAGRSPAIVGARTAAGGTGAGPGPPTRHGGVHAAAGLSGLHAIKATVVSVIDGTPHAGGEKGSALEMMELVDRKTRSGGVAAVPEEEEARLRDKREGGSFGGGISTASMGAGAAAEAGQAPVTALTPSAEAPPRLVTAQGATPLAVLTARSSPPSTPPTPARAVLPATPRQFPAKGRSASGGSDILRGTGDRAENGCAAKAADSAPPSFFEVLRTPSLVACGFAYFCVKLVRYSLLFWLPYFLATELGFAPAPAGYCSMLFDAGGVVGAVAVGFVADHVFRRRRFLCTACLCACAAVALAGLAGYAAKGGPKPAAAAPPLPAPSPFEEAMPAAAAVETPAPPPAFPPLPAALPAAAPRLMHADRGFLDDWDVPWEGNPLSGDSDKLPRKLATAWQATPAAAAGPGAARVFLDRGAGAQARRLPPEAAPAPPRGRIPYAEKAADEPAAGEPAPAEPAAAAARPAAAAAERLAGALAAADPAAAAEPVEPVWGVPALAEPAPAAPAAVAPAAPALAAPAAAAAAGEALPATALPSASRASLGVLILITVVGFFIAGPDSILGAMAAGEVLSRGAANGGRISRRPAAAARGLSTATGIVNGLGAFGGVAQGYLTAAVSQRFGWPAVFAALAAAALATIACLAWCVAEDLKTTAVFDKRYKVRKCYTQLPRGSKTQAPTPEAAKPPMAAGAATPKAAPPTAAKAALPPMALAAQPPMALAAQPPSAAAQASSAALPPKAPPSAAPRAAPPKPGASAPGPVPVVAAPPAAATLGGPAAAAAGSALLPPPLAHAAAAAASAPRALVGTPEAPATF